MSASAERDAISGAVGNVESGLTAQRSPDVLLDLRRLTKRFGATVALDDVDLAVFEGEILTLLGPSGSGKTTMLRLIAGFETPTQGELLLRGRDIGQLTPAERGIGMVFQHYSLFPHMTVAQNIEYPLKLRHWPPSERRQRVKEMLELVRLPGVEDRRPQQLSGGQQQRIALARAMSFRPNLLLMDEPLGALDRLLRLEMEEEIRRLHRELKATIVTVTHDQQEALALSDRIAIMRKGRIVGLDVPEQLYYSPQSDFVAEFFAHANLLPISVVERFSDGTGLITCGRSKLRLPLPTEVDGVRLAVRPSAFVSEPLESGDCLRVDGTVRETLLLGAERELTVDANGLGIVKAVVNSRVPTTQVGDRITMFSPVSALSLVAAADAVNPRAARSRGQ